MIKYANFEINQIKLEKLEKIEKLWNELKVIAIIRNRKCLK